MYEGSGDVRCGWSIKVNLSAHVVLEGTKEVEREGEGGRERERAEATMRGDASIFLFVKCNR